MIFFVKRKTIPVFEIVDSHGITYTRLHNQADEAMRSKKSVEIIFKVWVFYTAKNKEYDSADSLIHMYKNENVWSVAGCGSFKEFYNISELEDHIKQLPDGKYFLESG